MKHGHTTVVFAGPPRPVCGNAGSAKSGRARHAVFGVRNVRINILFAKRATTLAGIYSKRAKFGAVAGANDLGGEILGAVHGH